MPPITVLLPVHNGERYLEQAIASVLAQSFEDFELLIVNDGSTDRTQEIIDAFRDSRIRRITRSSNLRLIATLNEGLGLARGRYVARMDADDLCAPRRLELQYRYLEAHPEIGVLGSAVRVIDEHGRPGPVYRFPRGHDLIDWAMPLVCPMAHPSVMMRRDAVLAAGGYAAWALHAEDYDLWERMSRLTRFANLPEPLLDLRKHGGSVTVREAERTAATVATVCARCLSGRLGRPVSEAVARCLWGWSPCERADVEDAARILVEIYRRFASRPGGAGDIARREAGIRLLMLAARSARGSTRSRIALRATALAPGAWAGLGARALRGLARRGTRDVVG